MAEHDFRANDREGNRVNDFWTADIKGLYTLTNAAIIGNAGGNVDSPIKLIELSLALADADDLVPPAGGENIAVASFGVRAAKAGYWYATMSLDSNYTGAEASYKTDTLGTPNMGFVHHYTKYAVVAIPDGTVFGRFVFAVNEANTIYRSAMTGPAPLGHLHPAGTEQHCCRLSELAGRRHHQVLLVQAGLAPFPLHPLPGLGLLGR